MSEMVYSFSRVNTFMTCPHSFYASYIANEDKYENAWGIYGSYSHEVIERVLKGEIPHSEAAMEWERKLPSADFGSMTIAYAAKYLMETRSFFENFSGVNDEILAVERHFLLDIDGIKFQGLADLECRSSDGVNKIVDWKFAAESGFAGKKLKEKQRQLYFYALAFKEHYGDYPTELYFYLCLKKKAIKIKFNKKDLQEAIDWLKAGVAQIESSESYPKIQDHFFCKNLCGITSCEFNGRYGR